MLHEFQQCVEMENRRFKLLTGEVWTFEIKSDDFTVLSAPEGLKFDREKSVITWHPALTMPDIQNERFIVLIEDAVENTAEGARNELKTGGCERSGLKMTEIVLEVHECGCENGGECRWNITKNDNTGSEERRLECLCPNKYEGILCTIQLKY